MNLEIETSHFPSADIDRIVESANLLHSSQFCDVCVTLSGENFAKLVGVFERSRPWIEISSKALKAINDFMSDPATRDITTGLLASVPCEVTMIKVGKGLQFVMLVVNDKPTFNWLMQWMRLPEFQAMATKPILVTGSVTYTTKHPGRRFYNLVKFHRGAILRFLKNLSR